MRGTRSRYGLCFLAAAALHLAMPAGAGATGTVPGSGLGPLSAYSGGRTPREASPRQNRGGNAQWTVDFGDDSSTWARDRECDDPRFEGTCMSGTLLEEDRGRDATDCCELYEAGLIRLFGVDPVSGEVDFGDDSSEYAHDGECDDIRFSGRGMAGTLLDDDRGHDATDCRRLYEAGRIRLFGVRGGGRR
ncbi:MAG: hypothetical protein OXG04_09885 [Acidobacteria bacterium]|nr:hypothetical protein [Acidobacteriota bacterium]